MIQAGDVKMLFEFHKFIKSVWDKEEVIQQWKE
jgi:hypothetical protein